MILGVGIDSCSIERMAARVEDPSCAFVVRTFSEEERTFACSRVRTAESFAGIFAIKEAVAKALGCAGVPMGDFRAIQVSHREGGCPVVVMTDQMRECLALVGATEVLVSLTHEADLATAIALVQTQTSA